MPTRGFGMSARAQSRSIMPCSSGASSGVTSRARIARIATLSELHHCQNAMPMRDDRRSSTAPPGLPTNEHDDHHEADEERRRAGTW